MSALTFLGLAKRAGRVESGDDSVHTAARAGRAKLILTAQDAGRSTLARARTSAQYAKCPLAEVPYGKAELGGALGRESVGVAAVTDAGLARAFVEKLHGEAGGYEGLLETLTALSARAEERRREARRHEQKRGRGKKPS